MAWDQIAEPFDRAARSWRTYYVLAWLAAMLGAAVALHSAWHAFDNDITREPRGDGNGGHAKIDFGGQWLMGRLLVVGHGRRLYDRAAHREVLRAAYPDAAGEPGKSDVENFLYWMMGRDDPRAASAAASFAAPLAADTPLAATALTAATLADSGPRVEVIITKSVGGPLYPPVNAFVYAPLGLMPPRAAYRVQQIANVVLVFAAALGLSVLSRGRLWTPVVAVLLLVFPGYSGSINLGQNATLTLTILVWGWTLAARGRPLLGGAVWGLLAFKPVWAVAFFLVPFLTRRWRFAVGMALMGTALAAATLPVVGIEAWRDWLAVGREAAELYNVESNWIFLSRDLQGVPRRWLLDFADTPAAERDKDWTLPFSRHWEKPIAVPVAVLGWSLILLVLEVTARLAVLRRTEARRTFDGPAATFLLLGGWLCCFHFMYYDVLLAALPLFLLFTEPKRYFEPLLVAVAAVPTTTAYHRAAPAPEEIPPLPLLALGYQHIWLLNRLAPTVYVLLVMTQYVFPYWGLGSYAGPPWDTFFLAVLWLWCGWQWLKHGEKIATRW